MKCSSHNELVKRIDEIHQDLTKQNDRIFGLLESQLKQKDKLYTKIITCTLGTVLLICLAAFGLEKAFPNIIKALL